VTARVGRGSVARQPRALRAAGVLSAMRMCGRFGWRGDDWEGMRGVKRRGDEVAGAVCFGRWDMHGAWYCEGGWVRSVGWRGEGRVRNERGRRMRMWRVG